ncbi:hypothetical protein HK096_010113 [Nowakowskiella sp. JEL0078]|nr:hypothetical protein HK096_010113 [Nowakowskiella sp. JEL0078]
MSKKFICFPCFGAKVVVDEVPDVVIDQGAKDAETLQFALATPVDLAAIFDILSQRSFSEIENIAKLYNEKTTKVLSEVLATTLKDEVANLAKALTTSSAEYDATWLNVAFQGKGANEDIITEILVGRTSADIEAIKEAYAKLQSKSLVSSVNGESTNSSKAYFSFITSVITSGRPITSNFNDSQIEADIQKLYAAGEGRIGDDKNAFIDILSKSSDTHIKKLVKEYPLRTKNNSEFLKVVKHEFSGDFENAVIALVNHANNPALYTAELFEKALDGVGHGKEKKRDDNLLVRLILRHRGDLELIKSAFNEKYGKTLAVKVAEKTEEDYMRFLLKIPGGNGCETRGSVQFGQNKVVEKAAKEQMNNSSRYDPPIASLRNANKPPQSQRENYSDPSSDSLISSVAPSVLPSSKNTYSMYQEPVVPKGNAIPETQAYSNYSTGNSYVLPEAQIYRPSATSSQNYRNDNQYVPEASTFRPFGGGNSSSKASAANTYAEYYQHKPPVDSRSANQYRKYEPAPYPVEQPVDQYSQQYNIKQATVYPEEQYYNQYIIKQSENPNGYSPSDPAVKQKGNFNGNPQISQSYRSEPIPIGYSEKSDNHKDSTSSIGETHPNEYTSVADEQSRGRRRERKFCCCFSTRRSCLFCVIFTVIIVLVGLGLAVFFLFPRIPTYKVSDPYLLKGVNSLVISGNPLVTTAASPFSLTVMLAMNISLTSQNYIDYVVKTLTVNGTLLHPNGTANLKMTGYGLIADTNFKKMDTTKAVAVRGFLFTNIRASNFDYIILKPFNITYKTTSPIISGTTIDPDLNELLTACAYTGGQSSSLTISYTAVLDAPLISWITKPSYSDKTTFTCPITSAMWSSLNLANLLSKN